MPNKRQFGPIQMESESKTNKVLSQTTTSIVVNSYHLISALYGLAYGVYSSFLFIYLDETFGRIGGRGESPLGDLLLVLTCMMLFEAIAEPFAGSYADRRGRRKSAVVGFSLMGAACSVYGLLPTCETVWAARIVTIGAELIISIGISLQGSALEAWFAEAFEEHNPNPADNLELRLQKNRRWFTSGLVVGGSAVLAFVQLGHVHEASVWFVGAPWWGASALFGLTAVLCAAFMISTGRDSITNGDDGAVPPSTNFRSQFFNVWNNLDLRRFLFAASGQYVVSIVFAFFGGLLLRQLLKASNLDSLRQFLFLYPFALTLPRLTAPTFSEWLRRNSSLTLKRRLLIVGLCGCISCAVTGAVAWFTMGSNSGTEGGFATVLCGLLLTCLFVNAFRPSQTAFVSGMVANSSYRAFAISMTVPIGSIFLGVVIGALLLLRVSGIHDVLTDESGSSPLFVLVGVVGCLCLLWGLRSQRQDS